MNPDFVKKYFSSNKDVVYWWNPEEDIMAPIYQRGLMKVIEILSRHCSKGSMIFDAACGKGRLSKKLADFYKVTAYDISEEMLNYVRVLELSNVDAVKGDLEDIPFSQNYFDAIICLESFVHLPDIERVLGEFYRLLKPGGILIFNFDNKYGLTRMLKDFLDYFLIKKDEVYKEKRDKRKIIFRPLARKKIVSLLNKKKFILKKTLFLGVFVPFAIKNHFIVSRKLFRYISWLNLILERTPFIRRLSTYVYLVCQK